MELGHGRRHRVGFLNFDINKYTMHNDNSCVDIDNCSENLHWSEKSLKPSISEKLCWQVFQFYVEITCWDTDLLYCLLQMLCIDTVSMLKLKKPTQLPWYEDYGIIRWPRRFMESTLAQRVMIVMTRTQSTQLTGHTVFWGGAFKPKPCKTVFIWLPSRQIFVRR